MVFGWMPALAIYFRDPDGHALEFVAMLPDESRPEVNVVSWDEWQRLHGRQAAGDAPPDETSAVSARPALAPRDRGRR
jgi:hypothetical protein